MENNIRLLDQFWPILAISWAVKDPLHKVYVVSVQSCWKGD